MPFHEKLRRARLRAGLTQIQLAEAAGISPRSAVAYEQKEQQPGKEAVLLRLAAVLHVNPLYFVYENVVPSAVRNDISGKALFLYICRNYSIPNDRSRHYIHRSRRTIT